MAKVVLIVIAIIIVPIMGLPKLQNIAVKNITTFIKNQLAAPPLNITEETKQKIDDDLENMYSTLTYQLFMSWTNKTVELRNMDTFALSQTPEFLCNYVPEKNDNLLGNNYADKSLYTAKRRCGKPHCEQFRREIDKRKLCPDEPLIKSKDDGKVIYGVDEENVRCQTVESDRMQFVNIFKKNPAKVCLCVYAVEQRSELVSYFVYEDVKNKGVYHYTRLQSYAYNVIPDERAIHYKDRKIKLTLLNLVTFDKNILKKYKELFLMEETFESSCDKGAFKLVAKERYVGPADEPESAVLPREAEQENIASSSNSYSVPSSPIRPPPSPDTYFKTSSPLSS